MPSKPNKFRVGLVQMAMSSDPQANEEKAAAKVEEAARLGAEVVCLPEMYRTPYFCQREDAALFDLAEPVPGPSSERFARSVGRRPMSGPRASCTKRWCSPSGRPSRVPASRSKARVAAACASRKASQALISATDSRRFVRGIDCVGNKLIVSATKRR